MIKATSNAAEVIARLGNYRTKLGGAKVEIGNRLCDVGAEVAESVFADAAYAGTNDVSVSVERNGKEASVVAAGQAVAFIEFGAGVTVGGGYPGPKPAGIVGLGEYGQGRGANPKGWLYKGDPGNLGEPSTVNPTLVHTYGNPPAAGMYKAAREMEARYAEVAKEVLE